MQRFFGWSLSILALAACHPGTEPSGDSLAGFSRGALNASDAATHWYDVTLRNLTRGQPFSPGVIATHTAQATVWNPGDPASEGIRLIAENGDPSGATAALPAQEGVFDVVEVSAPIGCIGCPGPFPTSATYRVAASAEANRLSLAVMLICTNDGFTGVHSVKLPGGFTPSTHLARAYDAGTELNDELFTHIVDPCGGIGPVAAPPDGNLRTATAGVITLHPGITGAGNLTAPHRWRDPVLEITVQRVK